MRYTVFVSASPSVKNEKVAQIDAETLRVSVRALREDGRANLRLQKILGDYFRVSQSLIRIISGHASTRKIVEVPQRNTVV